MFDEIVFYFYQECLALVQLHYTAWPDHGVPKTTTDLIHMIELVRERHPWDDPPVLMHCRYFISIFLESKRS